MSSKDNAGQGLKQKTIHELAEFAWIFLYLAFFFCALELYSLLLLKNFHVRYLNFGFALINALVIAKVILLGEYIKLGKKYEAGPLILSASYKAAIFVVLVFAFHFLEEFIKHLLHGVHVAGTEETHLNDILGRSIVVFCTFLPLFAFRELRRVLGDEQFKALFFRSGTSNESKPAVPGAARSDSPATR